MRVEEKITVDAPAADVWRLVRDPAGYPELFGFAQWRRRGDVEAGCGARYDVHMPVGSAMLGGLVEVVEFEEPTDLAWHSVTGVDHRGRWRLRERDGCTTVTFRLTYQAPGGLLGLVANHAAAPFVRRNLREVLRRLRTLVANESAAA